VNPKTLLSCLVLVFSTGCAITGTTTSASRKAAVATKKLVASYRSEQQRRINDINHGYQEASGKVFIEMARLMTEDTYQDFDREALRLSEKYIDEWSKDTAPGKVSADFLTMIEVDFAKLRASEAKLDEIRLNYAKQYENAAAQLNMLQQIEANLDAVSKTKSEWNDTQNALKALYKAYGKANPEPGKENAKTDASTNDPAVGPANARRQ
jgi:hypothetical protein